MEVDTRPGGICIMLPPINGRQGSGRQQLAGSMVLGSGAVGFCSSVGNLTPNPMLSPIQILPPTLLPTLTPTLPPTLTLTLLMLP
jgi:hypothetical protein